LWAGDPGKAWAEEKDRIMDRIDGERGYDDERPYPNEHAARISDPDQYDRFRREADAGGDGIDFIYGIVDNTSEIQSIRFDADRYTEAEARQWLTEHDFDPIKFEPAIGERGDEMEERHIIDVQETDEAYVITFAKPHQEEMEENGGHEDMEERVEEQEEERIDRADLVHRAIDMDDRAIDEETRTVMVGVSSEEPVKRSFGMEVIDHSRESMNLEFLNSGRAPLLLDHDMERQIGVIESVELDEQARRLRAKVRFGRGEMASEVFNDVVDGIRQNISVGYRVDGRVKREDDDEEIYRVSTTPMEISIVSIPADQSNLVGVGRSSSETLSVTVKTEGDDTMSDIDLDAVRAEAAKAAQKNAKEIMTLARKHNKADMGEEAIGRGVSIDEFRGELLEAIGNEPLEAPAHVVDAPVKEKREYSLSRMINAQLTHDWSNAGFEREMHDEIARRVGKQTDGFYVPDFAFRAGPMSAAATGASGSENVVDNFIPTVHRGDMFVEALRAKQVMSNLGVTYMSGLTNRIKMPKFSAGANAGFVEELGSVSDQSQTDAAVELQPRTLGAYVDIGRIALKESIPALDQVVQDDLLRSIADRIEYYAINGSGSSGQPTGLINANITSVDISTGTDVDSLTWADIVALVKAVEENNAIVNTATQGWLSSPAVKAKLASIARVSGTDSVFLMNDPWQTLYGYPIEFTSNVLSTYDPGDAGNDASALIFGDWSQLMVGLFGAPSILVDETTGGLAGTVRIIVHQDVDIAFRHLEAFAKTDEVSVA
jgi:HK97 family phage major capsid protein